MALSEPVTALTDWVLSAQSVFCSWKLLQARRGEGRNSRRLWGWAFSALAAASLLGGAHHGFGGNILWKATLVFFGCSNFFLLAGICVALLFGRAREIVLGGAGLKLFAFLGWVFYRDDFRFALLDVGIPFAVILVAGFKWRKAPPGKWLLGGVFLSVAASLLQQSGITLHPHFDHNGLYHVVQMPALYLLYRGGLLLRDAGVETGGPVAPDSTAAAGP
ncbi:MAG: hypothetical protein AB1405_04880 [Bdellovibrionota bacterium]